MTPEQITVNKKMLEKTFGMKETGDNRGMYLSLLTSGNDALPLFTTDIPLFTLTQVRVEMTPLDDRIRVYAEFIEPNCVTHKIATEAYYENTYKEHIAYRSSGFDKNGGLNDVMEFLLSSGMIAIIKGERPQTPLLYKQLVDSSYKWYTFVPDEFITVGEFLDHWWEKIFHDLNEAVHKKIDGVDFKDKEKIIALVDMILPANKESRNFSLSPISIDTAYQIYSNICELIHINSYKDDIGTEPSEKQ